MNRQTIAVALIVSVAPTIVALTALFRVQEVATTVTRVEVQVVETHGLVNSRMDELLETTRRASSLKATAEEKEAQEVQDEGRIYR